MSSPDFDRNQGNRKPGNPDQEATDSRIPVIIDELTQASRLMKDPNYEDVEMIVYRSTDESKSVSFSRHQFPRAGYVLPAQPSEIKYNKRIIPVTPATLFLSMETDNSNNNEHRSWRTHDILLSLDKRDPTIFQLKSFSGRFSTLTNRSITGREKVVTRPELLPHILDAVSGRKRIIKNFGEDLIARGRRKNGKILLRC
jgi:hypothetical protein